MLQELNIDLRFSTNEIEWKTAVLPFKSYSSTMSKNSYHVEDPIAVEETS